MFFYAFTVLGVVLLWWDISGRLTADGSQLWLRKIVGISAAIVTGLTPLLLFTTGRIQVGPGFTFFMSAYLAALAVYLIGLLVRPNAAASRRVSRIGYATLLGLASLPSFVLIVLAAPASLAALGLTRPRSRT
jgi:hypothetical protein